MGRKHTPEEQAEIDHRLRTLAERFGEVRSMLNLMPSDAQTELLTDLLSHAENLIAITNRDPMYVSSITSALIEEYVADTMKMLRQVEAIAAIAQPGQWAKICEAREERRQREIEKNPLGALFEGLGRGGSFQVLG